MEKIKGNRDSSLDVISGIFIVYMIYSHICEAIDMTDSYHYVYLNRLLFFFMPWFFFKSGMFYKHSCCVKESLKKINLRYVKPCLIFSIITLPVFMLLYVARIEDYSYIYCFMRAFVRHLIINSAPLGNFPLWFLMALIVIKVFMAFNNKEKFYKELFITIIVSYFLWLFNFNYYRLFNEPILGCFFFLAGYTIRNIQYKKSLLVLSSIIYIISVIFNPNHISIRSNMIEGSWGGYFIAVLISLCGIIFFNNVFHFLDEKIKFDEIWITSILKYLGSNSMYFFVIHWPVLQLWAYIIKVGNINPTFLFFILPLSLYTLKRLHVLDEYT